MFGVAYKKDVSDMRESPALDILELLHRRGATVSYTDPVRAEAASTAISSSVRFRKTRPARGSTAR